MHLSVSDTSLSASEDPDSQRVNFYRVMALKEFSPFSL